MADDDSNYDDDDEFDLGYYEGERDENEARHGKGKAQYPNGDVYEGFYSQGKRQGKGCYKFVSGARYDGEYFAGRRNGFGTMYYPDGSKYEGIWSNNAKNGKGIYYYINGDTYDGNWKNDEKHGIGTMKMKTNDATIKGNWVAGRLHGKVAITYPAYNYNGMYIDGMLQGEGDFTFESLGIQQIGSYVIKKEIIERKESTFEEVTFTNRRKTEVRWKSYGIRMIKRLIEQERSSYSSNGNEITTNNKDHI